MAAVVFHLLLQSHQLIYVIGTVGIFVHLVEGNIIGTHVDQEMGDLVIGVRIAFVEGSHIVGH